MRRLSTKLSRAPLAEGSFTGADTARFSSVTVMQLSTAPSTPWKKRMPLPLIRSSTALSRSRRSSTIIL